MKWYIASILCDQCASNMEEGNWAYSANITFMPLHSFQCLEWYQFISTWSSVCAGIGCRLRGDLKIFIGLEVDTATSYSRGLVFFDFHVTVHRASCTVHRVEFLIIKPTRCTDYSNLFLEWNSTCFRQFLCPSSRVFHCTHSNGICHTGLLTACEKDQNGTFWSCSQVVSKPVWHIPLLCVQWKTPDDGQRNCPKHAKHKFEKLVHLVGLIIRSFREVTHPKWELKFVYHITNTC
jgi:hypothetical protein